MTITEISRKAPAAAVPAEKTALETAAVTRLLVSQGILDYSGHVSARIPGRDAFVIQIGSTSRAEVSPDSMLIVDYDGKVIDGDGQPPSELPIHLEILKARPDVQAVLHSHMELAIAFTMMEGVKLLPMRARATRWKRRHSDRFRSEPHQAAGARQGVGEDTGATSRGAHARTRPDAGCRVGGGTVRRRRAF